MKICRPGWSQILFTCILRTGWQEHPHIPPVWPAGQDTQSLCACWGVPSCWRTSGSLDRSTFCSADESAGGPSGWTCPQRSVYSGCRQRASHQSEFSCGPAVARAGRRTCHILDTCRAGCGSEHASWEQTGSCRSSDNEDMSVPYEFGLWCATADASGIQPQCWRLCGTQGIGKRCHQLLFSL